MEVLCLLTLYCGKIKRFAMARFSTSKKLLFTPAAPSVYEAIIMQFEPKVLISNQLPKGYLLK
jgi:hypothetical protein